MKKLYPPQFKTWFLMVAAMLIGGTAYAQTETSENATNHSVTSGDAPGVSGESYTIAGKYIAGGGSTQTGTMPSKGYKLRTNQSGGTVFTVNPPYNITKLVIDANSNYAKKEDGPAIVVTAVEVDGVAISNWEGGQFPDKADNTSALLTIDNITATESIAIYFDNSNAGGNQINACWEVTYMAPAADSPTLTVEPDTLHLVVGASYQLTKKIVPAEPFATDGSVFWFTGDIGDFMNNGTVSEIVSINEENDSVTALKAGVEELKLAWIGDPENVADTCVVVVSDFDVNDHEILKNYVFEQVPDTVIFNLGTESFYIWNDANKQCHYVYNILNKGFEDLYVQAAATSSSDKGWWNVNGRGFSLVGAGRCAAVANVPKDAYIEILYTGGIFVSKDSTRSETIASSKGPDAGSKKTLINEETGRVIYQMVEEGIVGFEIDKGQYIKRITIYDAAINEGVNTAIKEVEPVVATEEAAYNLMGVKVNGNAKGLIIKNGKKVFVK